MLLKAGFVPRRTVILVAGHDEELGGTNGAIPVAKMLQQRGVRFDYVIDEGLTITEGIVPGIAAPVALVGVAEKGYMSLQLAVDAPPGHSSMPPAPGLGAINRLAQALARLDKQPVAGGLSGVAGRMFETLAPEMALPQRVAMSNLWLLGPVVETMLGGTPSTNALMRTTTAMTMLRAGVKENVLPGRPRPSSTSGCCRATPPTASPPTCAAWWPTTPSRSRPSPPAYPPSRRLAVGRPAYERVARTLREVVPGVVVAPGLMLGGTDARWFDDIADHVFRFSPIRTSGPKTSRVSTAPTNACRSTHLAEMIRFYHRLLSQSAS
jgi:carboxypeptidase PM20D1